jgi:hypothetical protein
MAQIPQILKEKNLKSPDLVIGSGWGDRELWLAAIWPPKLGNVSNTWGKITYHKICNEHYNLPPGNNENLVYMYKYKDENPSTISTQRVQANVNMRGKPKL